MADITANDPTRKALCDLSNEISVPLIEVIGMVDLLLWIEKSRACEATLYHARRIFPEIDEALRRHEIQLGCWDADESNGLEAMHWVMRDKLSKVKGAVDSAEKATRPARAQP